jgi:hypothetical protein
MRNGRRTKFAQDVVLRDVSITAAIVVSTAAIGTSIATSPLLLPLHCEKRCGGLLLVRVAACGDMAAYIVCFRCIVDVRKM